MRRLALTLMVAARARGLSTVAPRRWRVRFRGAEVWADDGELLRTALLRAGVASPHNDRARVVNCRGLGTCGTCATPRNIVRVQDSIHTYPSDMSSFGTKHS